MKTKNQNKKQKLKPREHDWHHACQEMIEKNTANTPCCACYGHKCKDTPPSKSSSWEEKPLFFNEHKDVKGFGIKELENARIELLSTSKSSYWEEKLKSYMIDLIDEYFPKDNQDNPELPSTTHRSEAMASHALFLIKFKEILSSERADEWERVLNLVLEKMPNQERIEEEPEANGYAVAVEEIQKVVNSLKGEK